MKIYVDELPKDCIDCPCESEYYCNLLNEDVGCCKWGEIHKDCPLQPLADYTKQVRKEAIAEVRDLLEKKVPNGLYLSRAVLKKELDELQGENE